MPKVTEAHRRARRDEIADAAVRVLQRRGVSSTSIAQIVQESGLSAGAIYANFQNKSELARYVAQSLLGWRVDLVDDGAGTLRTPVEVLRGVLSTLDEHAPPLTLILQYWGEATSDPDLHAVLTAKVTELRTAFEAAVRPWAEQRAPGGADDLVRRTAVTMLVLCQGYLANSGLLGWTTAADYLATAAELFADG